jgi:hypothetical protein
MLDALEFLVNVPARELKGTLLGVQWVLYSVPTWTPDVRRPWRRGSYPGRAFATWRARGRNSPGRVFRCMWFGLKVWWKP